MTAIPQAVWWLLGGGGALMMAGKGANEAGEGVSSAANGAIKLAVAAGIGFWLYSKVK